MAFVWHIRLKVDESLRGNTWVAKKYNAYSKETFEKMGETCESQ